MLSKFSHHPKPFGNAGKGFDDIIADVDLRGEINLLNSIQPGAESIQFITCSCSIVKWLQS